MGYLFATLAVVAGTAKGYCGKRTSGRISGMAEAMMANCIRMCLCIVISFLLMILQGQVMLQKMDPMAFLIMAASGITTSAFVVSWIVAVKHSAYMLLNVFLMMGVLVPMLLCKWLFGEEISGTQWLGMGILLVAVLIMYSYNAGIKGKMTLGSLALVLCSGISNGLADFCQKSYANLYPQGSAAVFNFYTYVISAVFLAACWLIFRRREGGTGRTVKETVFPIFGYVAVMALCLFAHTYFKVLASRALTATQLFPFMQGLSIAASTFMSAIFFKEKITLRCFVGIALAFAGLLVMNIL